MFGLRSKILLGFGGLLLILVTVGFVANMVFRRFAETNQRVLRDDLTSVTAANDLQGGLQSMEQQLYEMRHGAAVDRAQLSSAQKMFDAALRKQADSVTLPAEHGATMQLEALWTQYQASAQEFLTEPDADRRTAIFHDKLFPTAQQLRETIDDIFRMNAEDIRAAHDEVTALSVRSAWVMLALTLCAIASAVLFAFAIGAMILRPVATLTDTVQQIERGNLEMQIPVSSRDELGRLAIAVNRMSAELRALKKVDHERLVRTQRTTQLAIDSLPDAVIVVSPDGQVEIANETARRMFKIKSGARLNELGDPRLTALHQRVRATGSQEQAGDYSATIRSDVDGELRFFMPAAVPILDENRNVIGATIVLSDVTNLRRLDEMKDNLLSMVSHELKTPLTTMRIVLPLLLEERIGALNAQQRELLVAARDDADRLHQIVENLLDLGRIAAGKAALEIHPADPRQLVQHAVERASTRSGDREIKLNAQLPETAPPVLADASRIGHVLGNLLENAQRYSRQHGEVTVSLRALEEVVEFSVADHGAGIPRQYLSRIFEKFFRVPGQTGDGGSGLGLAIVKGIVEAHGGSIAVESVEGRGSTFRFTLRRADHAAERAADLNTHDKESDYAFRPTSADPRARRG